jgi:hypothetical protein
MREASLVALIPRKQDSRVNRLIVGKAKEPPQSVNSPQKDGQSLSLYDYESISKRRTNLTVVAECNVWSVGVLSDDAIHGSR